MANNAYADVTSDSTAILVYASTLGTAQAPTSVLVKALVANSAAVYLGTDSSVATGTGMPLSPGEAMAFDLMGADAIWVISAAAQHVRYIVLHK